MACKYTSFEAIDLLVEVYNVRIAEGVMTEIFNARLNPINNSRKGVEQMKKLVHYLINKYPLLYEPN